ncbi:MAG: aromatic ring-hydroxylating dioxygenase subunit alpha [Gammaproteobacteria bacterium]|nr:aromatic ring-hydroxylating dioxygenase subunit alpha [Gammaproteobacteria bacterium]NNM10448.1 aromatic ring-hydroxylating dioxygenase subunit alpha [Pseudomonadales bacterium]RZV51379.1 MAG: aromatic ring-hydroxylating dioxygenase subunit alpha [Pseudomonadales bacterium]
MNKSQAKKLLDRLVQRVASDTSDVFDESLVEPATFFTDDERWQQEREAFFLDTPQLIGFAGELQDPGSYLSTESMGVPIIATRDEHGELHAFINACAHRGATVAEGFGTTKRLTCRFHGWSYQLDGRLAGRPQDVHFCQPKTECGLTPLPISDRAGLLMVGLRASMPQAKVNHALDDVAEQLCGFGFDRVKSLQSSRFEVAANWKLVVNLSHESYHFGSLHRESLAPLMTSHQVSDEFGLHTRWAFPFRGIENMQDQIGDQPPLRIPAIMNHTIFPGTVIVVNPGDAQLIRVEPGNSVDTSVVYFVGVCEAGAAADPDKLQASHDAYAFGHKVFETEDLPAAEQCQKGINAGLQSVIVGANEPVVQMWHRRWHEALDD